MTVEVRAIDVMDLPARYEGTRLATPEAVLKWLDARDKKEGEQEM